MTMQCHPPFRKRSGSQSLYKAALVSLTHSTIERNVQSLVHRW